MCESKELCRSVQHDIMKIFTKPTLRTAQIAVRKPLFTAFTLKIWSMLFVFLIAGFRRWWKVMQRNRVMSISQAKVVVVWTVATLWIYILVGLYTAKWAYSVIRLSKIGKQACFPATWLLGTLCITRIGRTQWQSALIQQWDSLVTTAIEYSQIAKASQEVRIQYPEKNLIVYSPNDTIARTTCPSVSVNQAWDKKRTMTPTAAHLTLRSSVTDQALPMDVKLCGGRLRL